MSEYIFKLPDLGEGTVESEIAEWYIKVGDTVKEEDVVGTMMTDKAAVELSSPVTGKVVSLAGEAGDTIAVGAPLVIFETDSTVADNATAETPVAGNDDVADPAQARAQRPVPEPTVSQDQPIAASATTSKIITSPAVRRRAREANIDLSQVPGSGAGSRGR